MSRTITTRLSQIPFNFDELYEVYEQSRSGKASKMKRKTMNQSYSFTHILLDETYETVEHIPGLKTTLYQHQKTVVKAMYDLEKTRRYTVEGNEIFFNSAVLSEPTGSGKTIDILALLLLLPTPRALDDILPLCKMNSSKSAGYVTRKFKRIMNTNLIFVGRSVLSQWEYAITTFTSLKYFVVKTVLELRKLFSMIEKGKIRYHIILVKNGDITTNIVLPFGLEQYSTRTKPMMYSLIADIYNICWKRVIIDDFDTIGLPIDAPQINALFTWFISSTRKKDMPKYKIYRKEESNNTIKNFTDNRDHMCKYIAYNDILFQHLNIRTCSQYMNQTMSLPFPKFYLAKFRNKDDYLIGALGRIESPGAARIVEMLNGNAYKSAAAAAGIESHSIADIFSAVLGAKFGEYQFASDLLSFIEWQESKEDERIDIPDNVDLDEVVDEVKIYRYGKRDLLKMRDIEYNFPRIKAIIEETKAEYTEIKKRTGVDIQRVKDNINHGTCPVCKEDLADCGETVIEKICGAVYCADCGVKAQRLHLGEKGVCCCCRATIRFKDLIYLGTEIKLADIVEDNIDDEITNIQPETPRDKFSAIIDIINGIKPMEGKRVDMNIPSLVKGSKFVQEEKVKKLLVFASFDETLFQVRNMMNQNRIKHWFLNGTSKQITQIANEFNSSTECCALIINSLKYCSGLNLQTSTDLIFTHKINDINIEAQVAGRGQRIGRVGSLNIWYLLYENECETLVSTHGMRELTQSEIDREVGNAINIIE